MAFYRSPDYQTSFKLVGLSVQEKKFSIDFKMAAILDIQSECF